jgi:hypothetical protein
MNEKTDQTKSSDESGLPFLKSFFPRSANAKGTRLLIWILAVVVIVLNLWVGRLYWAEDKFLDYFESSTFKALLASLLIPLLMSSISRAFKIGEKMEVEKEKFAHDKRSRQYQAIKDTNVMWNQLYTLSTEVAYFKDAQGKTSVREFRKKLESFANSAEEVVNLWHRIFPEVGTKDLEMLLPGLNLLLLSASTVADAIENGDAEAPDLQNCLLIIQDGVRFILHQRIMVVFNSAMEGQQEALQKNIVELRACGDFFRNQLNVEPNLPSGPPASAFAVKRKIFADRCLQYVKSQKEMPDSGGEKPMGPTPEEKEYYDVIYTIPFDQLGFSRKRLFSNDQIKRLAAEMFYQNDSNKIRAGV